jgi:multidrug efflux pump subunit AcrA (membrane-fusion protein)
MKRRPIVSIVRWSLGTALLVLGCTGAASADNLSNGSSAWSSLPPPPTSAWTQSLDRNQEIVRQTPTLSGRLEINKQTLLPYIGAGFGGGFVTERDRALGPSSVSPQQNLLGESLGKGAMPNEFQMGVRIPF